MKRNSYLVVYPRDFSNEYSIYRVAPEDIADAQEVVDEYDAKEQGEARWISRDEARKLQTLGRSFAENASQWFGGIFDFGTKEPISI